MHADSYFRIGSTHHVCEDYAWAGDIEQQAVKAPAKKITAAIVSDGCSSAPDSDIGARLLVRGAHSYIAHWGVLYKPEVVAIHAKEIINKMHLPLMSLDATLLTAYEINPEWVRASVCGDGVIAVRRYSGNFEYTVIESENNAPPYLSYTLDRNRLERYLEFQQGILGKHIHYDSIEGEAPVEKTIRHDECPSLRFANPELLERKRNSFEELYHYDKTSFDLVLVMTDGAQSFQRIGNDGQLELVPVVEVLTELMKIKVTKGRFLARRCQKFLGDFCKKNGWQHTDDFGIAGIYMGGDK